MFVNQLLCLPTPQTLQYLSSVMSDSPINLNPDLWHVEIISTQDRLEPAPNNVYRAHTTAVKVWYDPVLQRSSLIMSLESPDLMRRCLQLNEEGVVREFSNYYNPHLVVIPFMPPLSQNHRRFVVGLANALCNPDRQLTFGNEFAITADIAEPTDMAYNDAMNNSREQRTA